MLVGRVEALQHAEGRTLRPLKAGRSPYSITTSARLPRPYRAGPCRPRSNDEPQAPHGVVCHRCSQAQTNVLTTIQVRRATAHVGQ